MENDKSRTVTPDQISILRELGIVGYDSLEPIFIAALATEFPLLLIGPHGTAKSLLLNWLAEALRLVHRHYNAALINFDDLVGFPLPNNDRTGLEYIPSKGSIWGAESVFIDEISRTRIDMQNRLFPIIHEKVVLGIPLSSLRYRWAAMNPPKNDEIENHELSIYEGSQPLDIALADRFPFVVTLPSFSDFSQEDKISVIRGLPEKEAPTAGSKLSARVEAVKQALPEIRSKLSPSIASYIYALQPLLEKIGRPVSPRRSRMLHDIIIAVTTAELLRGRSDPKATAFLALSNALPHPAYGQITDTVKLLAAHNQAWKLAEIPATDPRFAVFMENDPVKRVALGLAVNLPDTDLSTLIQDAYAGLNEVERICFAVSLYPTVHAARNLTAATFEILAREWSAIEDTSPRSHQLVTVSRRYQQWRDISSWLSEHNSKTPEANALANIMTVLFEREVNFKPAKVEESFMKFKQLFPWNKEATV